MVTVSTILNVNIIFQKPKIQLPAAVFPSEQEEDVGLLNKAAPVTGMYAHGGSLIKGEFGNLIMLIFSPTLCIHKETVEKTKLLTTVVKKDKGLGTRCQDINGHNIYSVHMHKVAIHSCRHLSQSCDNQSLMSDT